MNIEQTLLAVLGIIIGIWAIKVTLKQKVSTQLLFFENSCFSLFKSVVKDLDDIEIKYKNKTIDENLILYKGTLLNSGNCDIDKSIIYKPVSIGLPKNYKWTKVKIIDKSDDVVVTDKIENNELILDWDILKEKEYITFDSIIECKPKNDSEKISDDNKITDELTKNIAFLHRIKNLKSINNVKIPSEPLGRIGLLFYSLFIMSFALAFMYFGMKGYNKPYYDIQYSVNHDDTLVFARLEAIDEYKIKVIDSDNNIISTYSLNDLKLKLLNDIKIIKKYRNNNIAIYIIISGIILIILLIILARNDLRDQKLYKKIKNIVDNQNKTRLDIGYRRKRLKLFHFY